MKALILSDLHLEFHDLEIQNHNADLVILAGDIHLKDKGVKWAIKTFSHIPVLYVLGNHEYYGSAYPKLIHKLKMLTKGTHVHILEKDTFSIDGINFIGCTLWTDFNLFGDPRIAGFSCQQVMSDYKKIRISPRYSKLRSIDVAVIHRQSLCWLCDTLSQFNQQVTVVITHHAPSKICLPSTHHDDIISAAYASDLDHVIKQYQPNYWIHGHLHHTVNHAINDTRIICNPRGYLGEENPDFDPHMNIEI